MEHNTRTYQGTSHFQNTIPFQRTQVTVIPLMPLRKCGLPCADLGLNRPVSASQFIFVHSPTIHHYFGDPVVKKANKSEKYGRRLIYSAQRNVTSKKLLHHFTCRNLIPNCGQEVRELWVDSCICYVQHNCHRRQ
jgi:hypothetical protein